jgi:hypothetical protein
MMKETWLVCGSRNALSYSDLVDKTLDQMLKNARDEYGQLDWKPEYIIEGECPCSADVYSKWWAENKGIKVMPFKAEDGEHLKRNIAMLNKKPTKVISYWNGYSYGTCFTIARAVAKGLTVIIIPMGPLKYEKYNKQ